MSNNPILSTSISTEPIGKIVSRGPITVPISIIQQLEQMMFLAPNRTLPNLLFVTHSAALTNNLGAVEAAAAIHAIQSAGHAVLDVQNQSNPFPEVRQELQKGYAGVVILGGYDVLPSTRMDALPGSLRQQMGNATSDADNFIVWNDEAYGDKTGDYLPDVPVSRIPDGHSPALVRAALAAKPATASDAFFLRNIARPFADGVANLLPSPRTSLVAKPTTPAQVGNGNARGKDVYVMAHGADWDGTRFWGEDGNGGTVEAMNTTNVPGVDAGVVLVGCCWGALTVTTSANNTAAGHTPAARTPAASIALSYLLAGVKAFVGCTGSHYSPTTAPYHFFGGPMHQSFWTHLNAGEAPAQALFNAKLEYVQALPHGNNDNNSRAIEFKILRQFTCLGLGW